jgi:hypothetical protein
MSVNKFKLLFSEVQEKGVNIPVEMTWDFLDRGMDIETYQESASRDVLNLDKDFEVVRFAHSNKTNPNNINATDVNYEFYFVNTAVTSSNISTAIWSTDYRIQGFGERDIYYFSNPFKRSFFKLDFYDSPLQSGQTNYFTVILPTQQGSTLTTNVGAQKNVKIKKPVFKLDYVGDKEGFFLYWMKKKDYLNISTFYMSAKFFDSKSGLYIKMMNRKQTQIGGSNYFNFRPENYFYYRVNMDYSDLTYKIYDVQTNLNVGYDGNPIKWYEYVNP